LAASIAACASSDPAIAYEPITSPVAGLTESRCAPESTHFPSIQWSATDAVLVLMGSPKQFPWKMLISMVHDRFVNRGAYRGARHRTFGQKILHYPERAVCHGPMIRCGQRRFPLAGTSYRFRRIGLIGSWFHRAVR
jgi:hypothetical protein